MHIKHKYIYIYTRMSVNYQYTKLQILSTFHKELGGGKATQKSTLKLRQIWEIKIEIKANRKIYVYAGIKAKLCWAAANIVLEFNLNVANV